MIAKFSPRTRVLGIRFGHISSHQLQDSNYMPIAGVFFNDLKHYHKMLLSFCLFVFCLEGENL